MNLSPSLFTRYPPSPLLPSVMRQPATYIPEIKIIFQKKYNYQYFELRLIFLKINRKKKIYKIPVGWN